jgi:hypothetical protein
MNTETRTISKSRQLRRALGWGASLLVVAGTMVVFSAYNRGTPQLASAKPVWFEAKATGSNSPSPATRPAATPKAAPISTEDKTKALGQLARIDRQLREYRRAYGEFPIGSNADISRTLRGDNPKKIIFVTPEELPINARGELIDTWQTPYFFHQISGSQMEIFSPGPDRQMWTADDLKVTAN